MNNILFLFILALFSFATAADPVRHYGFSGRDREKIKDSKSFFEMRAFEGAPSISIPRNNKRVTARHIHDFAVGYLKVTYLFWGTEEPFYSEQTVPFCEKRNDSGYGGRAYTLFAFSSGL